MEYQTPSKHLFELSSIYENETSPRLHSAYEFKFGIQIHTAQKKNLISNVPNHPQLQNKWFSIQVAIITMGQRHILNVHTFYEEMLNGRSCSDVIAIACFESCSMILLLVTAPCEVLRMISEAELQVLADFKSILYGLRFEKFGIEICVRLKIMSPRMMTQSAGHATTAPRGGRPGGRTGRGGGITRSQSGDQVNGRIDGQAQVCNQVSNPRNPGNQNDDPIIDNIYRDVRNVIVNNNRRGCTYKEFLACNPKEYDGKGGTLVYTRWIEKTESVQDMSGCEENQQVKYTAGLFFGTALMWWNSLIHTLSREAAVRMAWEDFKNLTREEFCPKAGTLTDEAVRNGSLKKNTEKRGNGGEPNRDRNVRDENKRTKTMNAFATTTNPVRREYNGTILKCVSYNLHHPPKMPCRACFNYGHPRHVAKDCRVTPRMVNRVKPSTKAEGNRPNQVVANYGGQGRGNNDNQARGRAFMLAAEEARQVSNIMTGTFTLNDHYATTLFNSGADYSFVSTTFIPLLGIEPSELGFSYEIEIACGQLVEIDKVIRGCKLEIEGHMFGINLIPFGSGSFDVIIGMDWLSNHKAEIICHEKVVRIPLQDGQVLRVIGERPEEKMRYLTSAKAKEQKQEEIVMVRDFPKVFVDDLSGLPPIREIEFCIELIPEAIPVLKSPYRLEPSEMEELSGQLKEL
ncbi:putative reverse transcriptase domain-containing protein [Tanacetum coccineum]